MRKHLLHSITSSVWMIQPDYVQQNIHLIHRILNGDKFTYDHKAMQEDKHLRDVVHHIPAVQGQGPVLAVRMHSGSNLQDIPFGSVAIIPIEDVIFKNDQYCGPDGLLTKMKMIDKAEASDRIDAIVFLIDSPGGEASIIETFAERIHRIEKPTLASFNPVCASAAWYAAAPCDEIYAQEETDIVGSTGTLISLVDIRGHLEKLGFKLHEIYADQSSLKNKDFKDALDGDYTAIKEKLLNPYAESFIQNIKKYRPAISDERVFKGDLFMAKEAVTLNMIEGIMPFEQVLERAAIQGRAYRKSNVQSSKNHTKMSKNKSQAAQNGLANLLDTLGIEELVIDQADSTTTLNTDQLALIEAALAGGATTAAKAKQQDKLIEDSAEAMTKATDKIKALNAELEALTTENKKLLAENQELGDGPEKDTALDTAEEITQEATTDEKTLKDFHENYKTEMKKNYGGSI